MTYNWYDTRASTWYEGYDPTQGTGKNQGSFVDLSTLTQGTADYTKALDAVTNNIIGLFEQKGITAAQAQASDDYKNLIAQAKAGDTKGAFQGAAAAVTSAADRGDLWGADASEGGDVMRGKSFFDNVSDTTTIQDLYTQGFGDTVDEIDAEGLKYWEDRLAGTGGHGEAMTIQEIAASFAASDEAQLRDAYHAQYGRDADDAGLDYWLKSNDESATGISDVDNFLNAVTYRGEDQDGDGIVSAEERLTSKYVVQDETKIRDDFQNIMGQVSNEANKANNPFYTAANTADVFKYMDHIKASGGDAIDPVTGERIAGVGNKGASYDNALFTNTHIGYKGLTMDAGNQGDVDDWDADGAQPTMMGKFSTKAEIKEYMDEHMGGDSGDLAAAQASGAFSRDKQDTTAYGQKVFDSVAKTTWGATTHEKSKDPEDYVTWDDPFGGKMTKEEAEKLIHPDNIEVWKKNSSLWQPDVTLPDPPGGGTSPDDWRPTPTTPDLPTNLPVSRSDINYIGGVSSDVQDRSGYQAAKRQFDNSTIRLPYIQQAAQGQVGKRLTDTSAKGVRMKSSKASRMGTIRGSKQLGREQQTKSLNI